MADVDQTRETPGETEESQDGPIPLQACFVSVYHVIILVGGLLVTTYFIGPDRLIACPEQTELNSANANIAMPLTPRCEPNSLQVLIFALCFGAIGSALNASRYVVLSVRHRRYENNRILWQILTPLHGGVLAVVAIYVIIGGLFSLVQGSNVDQQYGYFVGGFSFLVGFSSELFVKRLIAATEALFGESNNSTNSENISAISNPQRGTDDS